MSKFSDLGHWMWMEAQLGAPPFVVGTVMPRLHEAKETARLLAKPYLTLYQWEGQNEGGALTVTYAGLDYAGPTLKSLLFTEDPSQKEIGRGSIWRPHELVNARAGDITIVESSARLIRRLPTQNAIILPFRVKFVLDLEGDLLEVEQRFHRNTRRKVRKAKRYDGYEYEISRREQDLEMFYDTMYLPNVQERHGELAAILPEGEARQLLRHGWLFLVKRDGVYVCGCLGHIQQDIVEFVEMGVLNGDLQLMRQGAVDAMYYLGIRWAHQEGYQAFSFGESWPYMLGIFQSKSRWGAVASVSPYEHKQIWIGFQRNTPAVSQFLKSNPCVIVDSGGELQALIVTDDPDNVPPQTEAAWRKLYETSGLRGLLVRSVTDLMEKRKF
jgi:hypothetical protein